MRPTPATTASHNRIGIALEAVIRTDKEQRDGQDLPEQANSKEPEQAAGIPLDVALCGGLQMLWTI
ncbi:hypothetical protein [Orrella marina]|uniref:hypothetical protein n=1 Tax=Orrella marina TaxID=2163011 RepID=UPI00131EF449|nr:hypothetical protein [Orrella marina]